MSSGALLNSSLDQALEDLGWEVNSQVMSPQTFVPAGTNSNGVSRGLANYGSKSLNWCFTINNPDGTDYLQPTPTIKYMVYQLETGENGTPHLQGFIKMDHAVSLQCMRKLWCYCGATPRQKCKTNMCCRAHLEIAKKPAQARQYCMKEDTRTDGPWEFGEWAPSQQGRRSDIEDITDVALKHGYKRAAQEHPYQFVRYFKGLKEIINVNAKDRDEEPIIIVLWGATGTGKSWTARKLMPEDRDQYWVWDPSLGKWFQNYEQQDYVIFEEFRGQVPFGQLLTLLDRYSCYVEYKGGSTKFVATRIVFTSPVHPKFWYESLSSNDGQYDQLMRRLQGNGGAIIELTQLNSEYGVNVPSIEGWHKQQ